VDWFGGPGRDAEVFAEAQEFVRENALSDWLRFHGVSRQIASELRSADAVALFSFREGLPNVVCEAMACAKPILMSDVCDSGSLVVDGENGFIGDPRCPRSMAAAFQRFAALSPAARQEMGNASRKKAESLLAMETVLDRYERVLQAAAVRRPPPGDSNWPPVVPESARRTVARWSRGVFERAEMLPPGY
jgi:glycosyltransferase involved in cell wall biosynthesis